MNFAAQLSEELDRDGRTRAEQAQDFGISASNLSQFCSGKETCGEKQLDKILSKLPDDARDRLAAAWLRDRIPERIPPGRLRILVDASKVAEEGETWPQLDPELDKAAKRLLHKASRHPEIRAALLSFESALRG